MGRLILVFVALVGLGAYAAVALAESPDFVKRPKCAGMGTQVRCSASMEGLDDGPVRLKITAVGVADVVCIDRAGRRGSGRETTTVSLADLKLGRPRGGRLTLRKLVTEPPAEVHGAEACQGAGVAARIVDVEFTTATLRVFQGGELVVGPVTVPAA